MSSDDQEFARKKFPWARGAFELEGLVAAAGAWVVGLLLGMLWAPLFWLGFVAAGVCLMAGRRAGRTPPEEADAVCAPVDGIVRSIDTAVPPSELRMGTGALTRIRVASSPASTNIIYAPIAGGIDALVMEEGDPSRVVASDADAVGLSTVYVAVTSPDGSVGLRVATGGLGPRLDMEVEARDAVRVGRRIGKRRLGGWSDIYLPASFALAARPGMTLVGGETLLGTWTLQDGATRTIEAVVAEVVEPDHEIFDEEPVEDERKIDDETAAKQGDRDDDPSEMFARLRREAEKSSD